MDTTESLGESSTLDELVPPTHYIRHFNCTDCPFETTRARDFFYHKRDIHGNTAKIFECHLCPFASLYGKKLDRHMVLHRMNAGIEEGPVPSKFSSNLRIEPNSSSADPSARPKVKPLTLKRLNVKMPFKVSKMKKKLKLMKDGVHFKTKGKRVFVKSNPESHKEVYRVVPLADGTYHYQCIDCLYYAVIPSSVKKHHMLCHIRLLCCPHCNMTTRSQGIYYEHLVTHEGHGYIKCPDCSYVTGVRSNFEKHRSFHTEGYAMKCSVCNFGAESECKIKRHVATQHMPAIVPDQISSELPAGSGEVTSNDTVNTESWETSPMMEGSEIQQEDMTDLLQISSSRNYKNISGEELYEYRCPKCPMICYRRGNFTRHLTAKHKFNQSSAATLSKNMETLIMNGFKKSTAPVKLKSKKSFSNEMHKCSHCSYIAKWPSDLRRHMQVHTIVKRFKCSMCTNKYKYLGDLNVHMRRDHNMEPPETVAREFTHLSVIKKASPVVFRCPICPYVSHSKADLEQHSRNHGNTDKTYQCRLCEYQTYWRGDVGRHLFRHHKIILSKEGDELGDHFIYRPEIKPLTKQANSGYLKIPSLSPSPEPGKANPDSGQENKEFLKEGTPDSSKSSASSIKTSSGKASSKEGILYCEYPNCDFKAGLADRMAQHMAVHLNLKQFACPTCGKRTNWKWDIVKHMNKVHTNPSAGVEDVITLSVEEARASIDDYMSGKGKKGKKATLNFCSLCDFKSWDRQHVVNHIEVMHSHEEGTVLNRPLSGETAQDYSQFDEDELVKMDEIDIGSGSVEVHKFVEPPPEELAKYEKPYACAICKKVGSNKGDVKKHYNYTHPYKDVRILYVGDGTEFNYYTGEIYSKTLKVEAPGEMTESRSSTPSSVSPSAKTLRPDSKFSNPKMHGYVKPFKCSICGLRSNWKWDLKKHLRSKHSGEGGFVIMLSIEEASSTYGKDCSPSHPKHDAYLSIPKTGSSPSSVPDQFLFKQPLNIKAEILSDSYEEGGQMMDPAALDSMEDVKMTDSLRKHWKCSGCNYVTNQGKKIVQHINKDHALEKDTIRAILVSYAEGDVQLQERVANGTSTSQTSALMNVNTNVQSVEKSQLWDCPACPFKSQDKNIIISHMQQHSMKPYTCKVCDLAFRKKNVLHKHIYKKHKTNDYSRLTRLNITFTSPAVRPNGRYVSSYHCQLCKAESEDKAMIFLHLQEVHGLSDAENILKINKYVSESKGIFPKLNRKLHFCKLCPYRSQKKSMLTFHMTYHKPNPANKFKCKHCPYYVSTKRLLHQHQRKWHKDFNKLTWEHEEQTTPQSSPHKPHMGHYVTAGMQRRHFCEKCPYMTNSKNDFIYHKQFHRPRRTAEFKCEYCDYWVVHKRLLKQHMRLHTGKNFDCNGLSDSSPTKSLYSDPGLVYDPIELTELAAIKQKMISAKITSSLPKCGTADSCEAEASPDMSENNTQFIYKNGFYRKLNKCRYCPYTNTKIRNMQLHEMMHGPRNSDHNLLKCPLCDYYVGSKGLLSHHMKVHQKNYNEKLKDVAESGGMAEDMYSPPKVDTLLQITRFKRFGCERCPYASAKRQHFERHLELHGSRQRYTCQYCDYSVPSSNLLLQHTKLHMMPNQNLLSSQSITNLQHLTEVPADVALASALPPTDTETTVTVSVVHDHLGLYENSIYDSEPKKLYRCDRCPYANIRRDFLLSHLKFHIVPSAMNCPYCDYSAPKQPLLSQHIRVHFCPLPELSDWLLENGQTERETIQRHIDLAEALKVAQEYQNQCRNKDKTKTAATNNEEKEIKQIESEGKENVQETTAVAHICQYCDREFVTPEKLVKHELQHLIGNQFEDTANLLKNESACDSEVCIVGRKQVNRKQSNRRERARKKKNFHSSKSQKRPAGNAAATDVVGESTIVETDLKDGIITATPTLTNSDNTDIKVPVEVSSRENETCTTNGNSHTDRNSLDSLSEVVVHDETSSPASITENNAKQLSGDLEDTNKQVTEDLQNRSSEDLENTKNLVSQDTKMEKLLVSEELENAEKSLDVSSAEKSLEDNVAVPEQQLGDSGHEKMVVDVSMNSVDNVGEADQECSSSKVIEMRDKVVPTDIEKIVPTDNDEVMSTDDNDKIVLTENEKEKVSPMEVE